MNPDHVVTLNGADRTYQVNCRSINSMCRVEEATGETFWDVVKELSGKRPRPRSITIRRFLSAVLVNPPQPSPEMTGVILEDIGGVEVVRAAAQGVWQSWRRKKWPTRA